jgi:hypothetical protein
MDSVVAVVQEIEAAFGEVQHPGEANMLHPACLGDHESDIGPLRGFTSWQSIPGQTIELEHSGLTALSAPAFQFYLPAYMRWSLLNFRANPAFTSDATIYALAPSVSQPEYSVSRYVQLSPAQVRAVVSFLKAMAASPDHADAEVAERALHSYWLPRLGSGA